MMTLVEPLHTMGGSGFSGYCLSSRSTGQSCLYVHYIPCIYRLPNRRSYYHASDHRRLLMIGIEERVSILVITVMWSPDDEGDTKRDDSGISETGRLATLRQRKTNEARPQHGYLSLIHI